MKKKDAVLLVIILIISFFTGWDKEKDVQKAINKPTNIKYSDFTFDGNPEIEVFVEKDDHKISWSYPDENLPTV
ncbi:hypothetical protein [Peribacillus simplex]|uniref:Uncharacterized protein n=2 Tax=Peribacillus simplex TaxID=1478 RepID=A0A223EPN2_9BACI|nr:hypothetical protein [Peribacillus simplex]ASS92511.1 hypothetical protein BS1321_00070 [Peribacillus simplex NBRC 15720 = DSM 1321]ASS97166.1 hypothetical protein BS1321_26665 [Peribacillus simplex NBRC 15720 = DSM 1321]MEC1398484.1 hypothetical protein [Peribacillus simplex]MED3912507.1 hypothetical protein [Peribacillus simplex]TVX75817.1 hypothetical protein FQP34_26920 [Peribacillus simplex]